MQEDVHRVFYQFILRVLVRVWLNQLLVCSDRLVLLQEDWISPSIVHLFSCFYLLFDFGGGMGPASKVFTHFKCIVPWMQLQWSFTGTRPGVDCVQVTFTPHLSASREVFSDWRSVVWYIYGDFCADRCIVFIVTLLYWIWSPMACYGTLLKGH